MVLMTGTDGGRTEEQLCDAPQLALELSAA